jgi:flagellar hook-associated protein 2
MTTSTSGVGSLLNTSGISVGSDGKIQVGGLSSGIDTTALINAQIAADSVPITNLNTKITANNTLLSAYNDLKTKVSALQTSLDTLRNNLAFGSTNVFTQMAGSGTTVAGPSAPGGYTPSDINSLLATSFSSKAQTANHTITIEQLAQAQQISSDSQASGTAALGYTGTLTINGKDVNIVATDSMLDVRDKINAAGANVNATIVNADSTHSYLIMTSSTTGTGSNAITLTETALSDAMGLTNGSATAKNELTQAKNAIIDVDGITGITRSTNVISDVIDGVTLSLQKAEPNTVINLQVAPDLNAIKSAIGTFVTAYNDLRSFISTQNTSTSTTNSDGSTTSSFGPLYNNSVMRQVADQLQFLAATQIKTNADGYQSLSQIGVTMGSDYKLAIDDSAMDPKLLANVGAVSKLFGFSSTTSDSRINVISRSSSTQGGTYYLGIDGTDGSGMATGVYLNTAQNTGDSTDGSLNMLGNNVFQASSLSAANGLTLGFTNTDPNLGAISNIQITVQRGIADTFFDFFSSLTSTGTGVIDTQVSNITSQNSSYQSQIDTLNGRLATEKTNLTNKYAAMETALSQLSALQNQISQFFSASNNSNGNG